MFVTLPSVQVVLFHVTKPLLLPLVYFNPSRFGIKTTDLVSAVLSRSMRASFPLM